MTSLTSIAPRSEALRVLLDASSMLLGSATERSSETAILSRVLDLAFDVLHADGYAVWREFEQGRVWRVVARRGLSDEYRTEMAANGTIPRAVWRVEDVRVDPRLATELTAYEREGIRSMLLVPWMLGDTLSGTIVFYWKTPHRITQDEEDYAVALTNLSASALNRQELQDQSAREKQRLTFLAQASEVLASSLDYEATLKRVAQLAVSEIADWCTVHVVDHGAVTRLAVAHADPAMEYLVQEYAGKYPEVIRPEAGLGMVLATGEPEIYERITDEMVVAVARNEEHLKLLRALGLTSSILVPLIARGKVLGALRLLGAGSGRYFTQDDVHLAQDLARRAAVAIENARLHRAVLEHESELRLSHAAAHMGSWSMDLERDRIFWSDEFKALHGLERETAATYEGGSALVHPEDRDRVLAELKAVLSSDEEFLHFEHRVVTGDGRVAWLQNRGRVKRNEHGKAVTIAGIAIDVTESRLAELALRRTEKLAAAGRLAATVAHEVNNPLESLVNLVYLAQRVDGVPEEAKQHLQIADGELSRMAHIVRQTLGFYRESAIAKDVELSGLVVEVLELYKSRAGTRGLRLEHETAGDQLLAKVNAGEIKQVVANLISNAIDATQPGGLVRAAVRRVGDCIEIAVADTGSGITEANRKHLFEAFFTTKSDVGTGLGLWVSKGIVEKHGGTIGVVRQVKLVRSSGSCCRSARRRLNLPSNKQDQIEFA